LRRRPAWIDTIFQVVKSSPAICCCVTLARPTCGQGKPVLGFFRPFWSMDPSSV